MCSDASRSSLGERQSFEIENERTRERKNEKIKSEFHRVCDDESSKRKCSSLLSIMAGIYVYSFDLYLSHSWLFSFRGVLKKIYSYNTVKIMQPIIIIECA